MSLDSKMELDDLKASWDKCKAHEDQKNSLIVNLFRCIDDLSEKLLETESELMDKKDVVKLTRIRYDEVEKKNQALMAEKDRNAFASIIIDGDCMPFHDGLVQQGLEGGKKAASHLKKAVENELKVLMPTTAHYLQIIVHVYANMKGLAKVYRQMELLSESTYNEFVRGFNMGDPLFDYIDAGNGKECSDEKVKSLFRLEVTNVHCRQIFLGGTADNGYARLLGPYLEDESVRQRITLVEGPPFAQEMAHIRDKFGSALFKDVFRTQKLVNTKRKVSFHTTPPSSPSMNYASAATRISQATSTSLMTNQGMDQTREPGLTGVSWNHAGQRIDSRLIYSQQDFVSLKGRKLCNSFHLTGKCAYFDNFGDCVHEHGERLSSRQMMALRAVARMSPCQRGLDCDDPDCFAGHRCMRENCNPTVCRFSAAMHNVDTRVDS